MKPVLVSLLAAPLLWACGASGEPSGPLPFTDPPRPDLVIEADPAPPFTYWAPEGATIRNHPHDLSIWIAERDGVPERYYFGDQCGASAYRHLVGRPLADMPPAPEGAVRRTYCDTCAHTSDLGWARMNVLYDEDTRIITDIACY